MEVFRLSHEKFAHTLSGKGAALKGARWNSMGVEMIYTAANRSLAMAEVVVHLAVGTLPADFMMVTIFIPDSIAVQQNGISTLPMGWNSFPHLSNTQAVGDSFINESKFCLLKIPSVVVKGEFNFLINPNHSDFKQIEILSIEKFPFDNRIFR